MNRRNLVVGGTAMFTTSLSSRSQSDSFCTEIARIIALAEKIQPGEKRSDLDKDWMVDGGLMSPYTVRYTLRRCRSIKIIVDFEEKSVGSRLGAAERHHKGFKALSANYVRRLTPRKHPQVPTGHFLRQVQPEHRKHRWR
jgi:hypothetical protein